MAKKIIRSKRQASKRKIQNGIFSKIQLTESYTSLILGAIVVLIAGILFVTFAKINRNTQTSSTKDISKIEQNSNTSSTYTINPGDDLWSISENIYKDGYKWVEIAKINKLENPDLIHVGNKLIIPSVSPSPSKEKIVVTQTAITKNSSITGFDYSIEPGDNLWNIAVRAYGDGFKWPEIAKVNKLENPSLIHSNNVLKIPR